MNKFQCPYCDKNVSGEIDYKGVSIELVVDGEYTFYYDFHDKTFCYGVFFGDDCNILRKEEIEVNNFNILDWVLPRELWASFIDPFSIKLTAYHVYHNATFDRYSFVCFQAKDYNKDNIKN